MTDHEEIVTQRGERSGAYMVVAVHSTVLGPALGGLRVWRYPSTGAALADAMRLSTAMTMKAAATGLDLGGGKGVICAPEGALDPGPLRTAMLLDFADLVESLGGRYITGEDVGTGPQDMAIVARRTRHVVGLPVERGGSGDPSQITALGVEAAMRACARRRFGTAQLAGLRVAVIGLGAVGGALARRLVAAGVRLSATDIDPGKRALAAELGASWLAPETAATTDCHVLAPCALGGAVDGSNVERLRAAVVCGSANNILADDSLAPRLAERGILYAPDFLANAAGLISVYGELHGHGRERAEQLARGIEHTLERAFEIAAERSITPLDAAFELARRRLEAAEAAATATGSLAPERRRPAEDARRRRRSSEDAARRSEPASRREVVGGTPTLRHS